MLLTAILGTFALSLVAPSIHRVAKRFSGWLIALVPFVLLLYFLSWTPIMMSGEPIRAVYSWVPSLGINLTFHADGLSWLFTLLITGIGIFIFIYAGDYHAGDPLLGRLYAYLLVFMAAMLGLVLSNNLITLFVFWELTSFSSYLLIGFKHESEAARKAALRALLVTGGGGLALMGGLILLGIAANTFEISDLVLQSESIRNHYLYPAIVILILLGAFTKSAQFPFHFWLPGAMEAPTPVSAYLHSATMVKAGVFLLARLNPVLGGTGLWQTTLVVVGAVTMLIAAYLALRQVDLKRILAYSTVSSLGILVFLLGLGSHLAIEAAVLFLVSHSLYKGALFLVAGVVDHETGTRNINRLGGLARVMPIIASAVGLAALSMAGFPPLVGFASKELVYETVVESETNAVLLTLTAVAANVLLVAVAGMVALKPFVGELPQTPKHPHKPSLGLWLGPLALAALGFLAGLFIPQVGTLWVGPAASVILAQTLSVSLALWHGINLMLILSVVTVVLGMLVYLYRDRVVRVSSFLDHGARWGPGQWYEKGLNKLLQFAAFQTHLLQHGYLRYYLLTIVAVTIGLVGITFAIRVPIPELSLPLDLLFHETVIAAVIVIASVVVLRTQSRLTAVAALGVVGYSVAVIFILYGAPDLAMTQFAIETLTVILMVLVMYRLPPFAHRSTRTQRLRDAAVAIAFGLVITVLVLVVTMEPLESPLKAFFGAESYLSAHGRNVVNVILVDFRGVDTLGEITVLAVAALGVLALLKLRPERTLAADEDDTAVSDARAARENLSDNVEEDDSESESVSS